MKLGVRSTLNGSRVLSMNVARDDALSTGERRRLSQGFYISMIGIRRAVDHGRHPAQLSVTHRNTCVSLNVPFCLSSFHKSANIAFNASFHTYFSGLVANGVQK